MQSSGRRADVMGSRKSFTCNSVTPPEAIQLTERVSARVKKLAGASPQTNLGNKDEANQINSRGIEIDEQLRNEFSTLLFMNFRGICDQLRCGL
jgi:hypothetical protein